PIPAAAVVAFAAALLVRGGALRYGWAFPRYRSRPGRRPEDIP
ncbi:MAG: trimeric intracellular cation channel family protein, partial [Mesorhizobium sp.]